MARRQIEAGIATASYPYAPGRADFCALLKGDGSLKPLISPNHMDVVQADARSWKVPPFSGEIRDGEVTSDESEARAQNSSVATQKP